MNGLRRKRNADAIVTPSSGNIFADVGIANAGELQTKVKIAFALNSILERLTDHTQKEIADLMGTDQSKVSNLRRYRLDGLSVERLMGFLTALGFDIEINIQAQRSPRGRRKSRPAQVKVNLNPIRAA